MNRPTRHMPLPIRPSPTTRPRQEHTPEFKEKLRQMGLRLSPLVQITTGQPHPEFPQTLLAFWLLTEAQLDSLAEFYHQRHRSSYSAHYPCPVSWHEDLTIEEKRRKIGKFIGLRGCDTPVVERRQDQQDLLRPPTEEEIMERARRARLADEEDEMWRRKLYWYS